MGKVVGCSNRSEISGRVINATRKKKQWKIYLKDCKRKI